MHHKTAFSETKKKQNQSKQKAASNSNDQPHAGISICNLYYVFGDLSFSLLLSIKNCQVAALLL